MTAANIQENETATGFTATTTDSRRAFLMAENMAFKGYSVKLSGVKGSDWTVEVVETDRVNLHGEVVE